MVVTAVILHRFEMRGGKVWGKGKEKKTYLLPSSPFAPCPHAPWPPLGVDYNKNRADNVQALERVQDEGLKQGLAVLSANSKRSVVLAMVEDVAEPRLCVTSWSDCVGRGCD